jgi:microcystin-dependent protein
MAATEIAVPGTVVPSGALVSPGGGQGVQGVQGVQGNPGATGPTGPTGAVMDYAGATAPSGWLLCDGTSYSTTTYAALFAVIGYTFGGSGANFNVPDARGRTIIGVGQGTGLTNRVLGGVPGEENHPLTAAELASHTHTATSTQGTHTHTATDSGHTHTVTGFPTPNAAAGTGAYAGSGTQQSGGASAAITVSTVSAGAITTTVTATGTGNAHNNMQPSLALNKIIKT